MVPDALILRYLPLAHRVAAALYPRLSSVMDLDDLKSASVIGLMEALTKYSRLESQSASEFKPLATVIIRSRVIDSARTAGFMKRAQYKKLKLEVKRVALPEVGLADPHLNPEQRLMDPAFRIEELIRYCQSDLTHRQHLVLRLYIDGMGPEVIAAKMNMHVSAVYYQKRLAVETLTRCVAIRKVVAKLKGWTAKHGND